MTWELTRLSDMRRRYPKATVVGTQTGHRREYHRNPYLRYFRDDRLSFPVDHIDRRLPVKTPVVGVRVGQQSRAYPAAAVRAGPNQTLVDPWPDGQRLVLQVGPTGGVYVLGAPGNAQVAHTFWFAWSAFHPQTSIYGQGD